MGNNTKKKINKVCMLDYVGALFLGFVIIFGLLVKAGTLTSGFHFADDHELIRMELGFSQQNVSLGQAILNWMDLHWRFRPFYWVERVTGAYLWGSNLLYWNCYTALKGVLAFYCLYMMSRYLKFDRIISAIVPCVVMLGSQFTPWYRSANQESTGLLFCAVTLCLIAAQAYHRKYTDWRYNVPIMIGAILCGLMKESFTLFMPVFIALKFWLEYWDEENADMGKARWLRCLKSNVITYGGILLSLLVNVCLIVFYVGVDKVSYAGFQEGTTLSVYLSGMKTSLMTYTKWYTVIGGVMLLLIAVCYKDIERKAIGKYCSLAVIGLGACVIQLVAHAKSGMWERYIIPYIVGYVLVFVLLAYRIFERDKVHRLVFLGVMMFLLYQNVLPAYRNAQYYRQDGENIARFLDYVRVETDAQDRVICAFGDEELNLAVECWLESHGRPQAYSYVNDQWKNIVQLTDAEPAEYSWTGAKAVACYAGQTGDMIQRMGFTSEEQYELVDFWNYSIVLRKGSE